MHVFSDGPTSQYKQKGNFLYLSSEPFKFGFETISWHFFEASHGNGAPRTADRPVRLGRDIKYTTNNNITSMVLKSSEARAQKRNKTKSVIIFKSRGHTGVIISFKGPPTI